MTLDELESRYPLFAGFTETMPPDIRDRCVVRTHPKGSIVHRKDMELDFFGIVAEGESRVVNEFENGSVYMIEKNEAPDFVGEVTILARMETTSVTIQALTDMTVAYIPRSDAERWLFSDIEALRGVAGTVAFKLYRSSRSNGAKLFYPPSFLLMDHLVKLGEDEGLGGPRSPRSVTVRKTRKELQEELGINVKTLDRTVRSLREAGLLGVERGKITFTLEQYRRALPWLRAKSAE